MRRAAVIMALIGTLPCADMAQNASIKISLPTDNDALFSGDGPAFYQYIERDYKGQKSTPWEGGQYGFVRDPIESGASFVFTRFHEGIDIRCLQRDARGEPLDEVRAIANGRVVHTNLVPGYSNYGKYVVIEHQWGGSSYYSLYGHLRAISVQTGTDVNRGQPIGTMGYTGTGLNQARAHVHLELNVMLNHHFDAWYDANFKEEKNHNGIYNGINLSGLDIARLYLALQKDPSLTIPDFLAKEEVFYKVAIPAKGSFELPTAYPWTVASGSDLNPRSWIISFTRSSFPLKIEASDKRIKEPQVVYAKSAPVDYSLMTQRHISGKNGKARLDEWGRRLIQLLTYPE